MESEKGGHDLKQACHSTHLISEAESARVKTAFPPPLAAALHYLCPSLPHPLLFSIPFPIPFGDGEGGGKGYAILPKKNEGEQVDSLLAHFEATFQEGR